ncbi:hypothetical protein [Candidatus Binatus sp.]|uniref:hypothetical protein n=2 Tax=Candidatus Binatus sp. TaxID=2811406 RepID=UPI003BB1EC96
MKRTVLSLLVFLAAGLVTLASPALAQEAVQMPQPPLEGYYTYGKLRGVSTDEAMRGAAAATTVPMWGYTVTSSRDSNTYSGVMVGRSPFFHGARTTTIPVVIIPVKFTMTDHDVGAQVFDPTAADPTCSPHGSAVTVFQNSPILNAVNFTMPFSGGINVGSGQYVDEFQRANFWSNVSTTGNRFHTTLSPVTTLPVQAVTVPTGHGKGYLASDFVGSFCGSLGGLDGSWWDPVIFTGGSGGEAQTLISSLTTAGKISPTQFPIFLFYNVVMNQTGESACGSGCALGYHNSQGFPVQTYGVADWDTTLLFDQPGSTTGNSSVMSHEVAEWMDDPLGSNPVPPWGHIGQQPGCQGNLEVGDALSGTIVPQVLLNGMEYDLQELVFFSWFYGAPSIAVDGTFSDNNTFTSDAGAPCT